MGTLRLIFLAVLCALAACASPETGRSRGGGPGADVGNRTKIVRMHEGADPFYKTPKLIPSQSSAVGVGAPRRQAQPIMTASIDSDLRDLGRQRPEWEPWLAVVQEVLSETANAKWDAVVPDRAAALESKAPLLAGAVIAMETSLAPPLDGAADADRQPQWHRKNGHPEAGASSRRPIPLRCSKLHSAWMKARLNRSRLTCGADPEAFQAVAALLPVPFLHACNRRWAHSLASRLGGRVLPRLRRLARLR